MTFTARPHHERPSIRAADALGTALGDFLLTLVERAYVQPPRDDDPRPRVDPPPAAGVSPRES